MILESLYAQVKAIQFQEMQAFVANEWKNMVVPYVREWFNGSKLIINEQSPNLNL